MISFYAVFFILKINKKKTDLFQNNKYLMPLTVSLNILTL